MQKDNPDALPLDISDDEQLARALFCPYQQGLWTDD